MSYELQKAWNSSLHPRAKNGQFASKGNVKNTIQQKRIALANKAPLLTNIQLLNFNRRNWKVIITQAMNLLEYKLKNQIIVCRADVKLNGITQRISVSVIVVHNGDNVSIKTISVFRIEDRYHLIKSYARKAPKGTAKQVADIYAGSH